MKSGQRSEPVPFSHHASAGAASRELFYTAPFAAGRISITPWVLRLITHPVSLGKTENLKAFLDKKSDLMTIG
jgi:hypothetical protein